MNYTILEKTKNRVFEDKPYATAFHKAVIDDEYIRIIPDNSGLWPITIRPKNLNTIKPEDIKIVLWFLEIAKNELSQEDFNILVELVNKYNSYLSEKISRRNKIIKNLRKNLKNNL